MRRGWLARAAVRLLPAGWRDTVREDLDEETRLHRRTALWQVAHLLLVGIRLRWAIRREAAMFDLRSAVRSLWRARWFTLGATLVFAIGIGVNTAVFSSVDRILFRPLPYAQPHELVLFRSCNQRGQCYGAFPSAIAFHGGGRLQSVGEMAVAGLPITYRVSSSEESPPLTLIDASANLLRVLGVRPAIGRDVSEDDLRERRLVAFLSHETWQQHFAADSGVIGTTLRGGASSVATVIGVLPHGFFPPTWAGGPIWHGLIIEDSGWSSIGPKGAINPPIARLRPGATLPAARAEVDAVAKALDAERTAPAPSGAELTGVRADLLERELFSAWRDYAWLVSAAAGFVLLMACVNLAGLLLARGRSRERETAMRAALGASTPRIVAASLLETLLVCLAGAAAALIALAWTSQVLISILPPVFQQYVADIGDRRVLAFSLAAAVVCSSIAGAWPAVRIARVDVTGTLLRGTGTGARTRVIGRSSVLAVQATLGILLLLGAVTTVRSFTNLVTEDLGFDPENLYRVSVPTRREQALAEYEVVLQTAQELPGVLAVAGTDRAITSREAPVRGFSRDRNIRGPRYEVSADYFKALRTPLLAGRGFSEIEVRARSQVAVIDAAAVQALWPGKRPEELIGQSLSLPKEPARVIVGVAANVTERYGETPMPTLYVPLGAEPMQYTTMLVRMEEGTAPDARLFAERIALQLGSRRVTVAAVRDSLSVLTVDSRFRAVLLSLFAVCALVLSAAGIYALASHEVFLRRPEMGLRAALGASTHRLRLLVLRDAVGPVIVGSLSGVVFAYWIASLAQTFMYGVDARDPSTFAFAVLVLVMTAIAAAWFPARRAARSDPAVVLRSI